ncbi:MAG: dephospho-CoA kinase, partial [Candidatus Omnitrophica bacterium]|nr:dephospho-CoA kinase [Candidatus Omnitrophota bacterium]
MVVIGVTGGVGTGKSTVAGMFKRLGAVVLDADRLAHEAMEPKRLAWRQTVKAFGEGILNDDQTVNRRRLAALVFQDEQSRRRLEGIVHPQVVRAIRRELHRLRRSRRVRAVVLDVPLLVEAGAHGLVEALVVVTAPPGVQRKRLQEKFGWSDEEMAARLAAQWELSAKVALADQVVDNSDGVDATRAQVKRIWNQLVRHSSN